MELWWLTSGFAVHPGCQSCRPCIVASLLLHVAPIHAFHNNSASRRSEEAQSHWHGPHGFASTMKCQTGSTHTRSRWKISTSWLSCWLPRWSSWEIHHFDSFRFISSDFPTPWAPTSGISPRHRWFDRDTSEPGCELSIANSTADNENWILACTQSNNQNYIVVLSIMYRNTII